MAGAPQQHAGLLSPSPLPSPRPSPRVPPSPSAAPESSAKFFEPHYLTRQQVEDESPSVKAGAKRSKVAGWRKAAVEQIFAASMRLKLDPRVRYTASVFMHQFYASHSFQANEKFIIATAALFLACKSENYPRRLDEVIMAMFCASRYVKDPQMEKMFRHDEQQKAWLRDLVLKAERCLLYTIGFRFTVVHPATPMLQLATRYKLDSYFKGGSPQVSQIALNFVNDSCKTTLHLRLQPRQIAAGALYTALKLGEVQVPPIDGKQWYVDATKMSHEAMEAIAAELLDLYERKPVGNDKLAKGSKSAASSGGKGAAAAAKATTATPKQQRPPAPGGQAVPPAPLTPAADASPARAAARSRERSPSEGSVPGGSGKRSPPSDAGAGPAAKRVRTDGAAGGVPAGAATHAPRAATSDATPGVGAGAASREQLPAQGVAAPAASATGQASQGAAAVPASSGGGSAGLPEAGQLPSSAATVAPVPAAAPAVAVPAQSKAAAQVQNTATEPVQNGIVAQPAGVAPPPGLT